MERVRVVDSHTEGEPTRVVIAGGPALGEAGAAGRRELLRSRHDGFRAGVVLEPRGHEALVGALLGAPASAGAVATVVFFNNVGVLHGCVHGTIGVAATLRHLGRIGPGRHRLETPVGDVAFTLAEDGGIAVENVVSRVHALDVPVETEAHGRVRGDVAWGGNWFFLAEAGELRLDTGSLPRLVAFAEDLRRSLRRAGITGEDGAEIDHVELFGPPREPGASGRNFVLCPGGAYDRSPCGTGTSAKLACLAARGALEEGVPWIQESVIGSRFRGHYRRVEGGIVPTIEGRAWITAEAELLFAADDPFREGIGR